MGSKSAFKVTCIAAVFAATLSTGAMAQSGEKIAVFTKNQTKPDSIPEQLSQIDDMRDQFNRTDN